MRIFAYSVRGSEFDYFKEFQQACVDCAVTDEYPSMSNLQLAQGYDAVSIITNVITKEMYEGWHAMGVRYIATRSAGFDHLDTALMKQLGMRGVHATYSPNAVANYTIMLMLMACRKVNYILDKARLQDFTLTGNIGKELSLCTVGVIGTGQIGETVVRHLSGFGCRILVYDVQQKEALKPYATYVDMDTLLHESDVITLHVPGMASNRHMIDRDAFAKMKDDVIFINTARGVLVDSYALIEALESGKVGFAALDTYEEERGLYYKNLEQQPLANRVRGMLMAFPNVILSPHMAFYTEQSVYDMVGTSTRGLLAFEAGGENPAEITY